MARSKARSSSADPSLPRKRSTLRRTQRYARVSAQIDLTPDGAVADAVVFIQKVGQGKASDKPTSLPDPDEQPLRIHAARADRSGRQTANTRGQRFTAVHPIRPTRAVAPETSAPVVR